jgi:aspartate aminotransferase
LKAIESKLSHSTQIKDYPSMLKILLLQTGSEVLLLQWEARWILEMKSSSQNHFTQITMVFSAASGVNVVPVISSIDTGFALPAIADFEKLITPKNKSNPYL